MTPRVRLALFLLIPALALGGHLSDRPLELPLSAPTVGAGRPLVAMATASLRP